MGSFHPDKLKPSDDDVRLFRSPVLVIAFLSLTNDKVMTMAGESTAEHLCQIYTNYNIRHQFFQSPNAEMSSPKECPLNG